jgi:HEAT repeat protein
VSPDRFVRSSSALLLAALGELGATDELIARLIALLRDNDAYAREAAACALGRMGATAAMRQGVLESLTRALEDTSEDVHAAALSSLTHLREVRASEPAASPVPPIGPTPDYSPSGPAMEPAEPAPETPVESPTEFLELGR